MVTEILTVFTAAGAVGAAIGAWRTAVVTRRAAVGVLVNDLLKEYKTVPLRDALRRLEPHANDVGTWVESWWERQGAHDAEAQNDEDARYLINGFFNRVADLERAGLLTGSAVRLLVQQRGINIWYGVVEPMTKKLDPNIADSPFEVLRKRWLKHGYLQPLAHPGVRAEVAEQQHAADGAARRR